MPLFIGCSKFNEPPLFVKNRSGWTISSNSIEWEQELRKYPEGQNIWYDYNLNLTVNIKNTSKRNLELESIYIYFRSYYMWDGEKQWEGGGAMRNHWKDKIINPGEEVTFHLNGTDYELGSGNTYKITGIKIYFIDIKSDKSYTQLMDLNYREKGEISKIKVQVTK